MLRIVGIGVMTSLLSGCLSLECGSCPPKGPAGSGAMAHNGTGTPPTVPGVQGPYGQPVLMAAPYSYSPPHESVARSMLRNSVPLELVAAGPAGQGVVRASGSFPNSPNSDIIQAQATAPGTLPGAIAPPGVPFGPGMPGMPGMAPPGMAPPGMDPGAAAAAQVGRRVSRTEVRFVNPPGMKVAWYAPTADGKQSFSGAQLETPGRYNFIQAAIYRLKLSDIPNRPNLPALYPTLEVVPCNPKTESFLAHSTVPVSFTDEDFEQVASGNYIIKVIYLPDPQFQDLATTGPDEVVSSRLEPGVDPITEAMKRGSILLVVRMGNIDLELPNTPAMDAPSPYTLKPPMAPRMMPGMPPMMPGMPIPMAPYKPNGPMGAAPAGQMPPGMGMGPNGQLPPGVIMGPQGPMIMGPNGPIPLRPDTTAGMPPSLPSVPGTPPASSPVTTPTPPEGNGGLQQQSYRDDSEAPPRRRPSSRSGHQSGTTRIPTNVDQGGDDYEAEETPRRVAKKPQPKQEPEPPVRQAPPSRLRRWQGN